MDQFVAMERLGYHITFDDSTKDFLAKIGFDEKYGARPIKRAIQEKIEDFISEEVLRQNLKIGGNYTMSVEDETVSIKGDE